jgi:O-antigen ligase/tetratricopeptide (TPR) repeat protein
VALLLVLTPLPEGSAYPWALAGVEAVIFGLAAFCRLAAAHGQTPERPLVSGRRLILPLLLFAAVAAIQMVPIPPALLQIVSPSTYRLYELSVAGWRQTADGLGSNWRSISIAPSLSLRPLLKAAAYVSLFSIVCFYPFGSSGRNTEKYVYRSLIAALLASGLIVAVIGIVEFFTWNGKILWLFVPYDWGAPQLHTLARALGPFVNFDHFGNYLALVLPLAVGGALFPDELFPEQEAFPLLCATVAFLALCGLLLSGSRGAWIAAAIALGVLMLLSRRMPRASRLAVLGTSGKPILRLGAIALAVLLLSILFIGQQGRNQIDERLQGTFQFGNGRSVRSELTGATLAMARDYPLLGVGLGCWPELFAHYQPPPWLDLIYREAHNDYAQLLAETGVVGFALLAWFFAAAGRPVFRALAKGPGVPPVLAALSAALSAMAFHEFFDFSLQTPANAVLFIVLAALTVRMSLNAGAAGGQVENEVENKDESLGRPRLWAQLGALCTSALALALIACALGQDKIPYPYDIKVPGDAAQAAALISAHPALSNPHLQLVRMAGDSLSSDARLGELRAAVWLDPNDPYARDEYALALLHRKMVMQGFDNVTLSVRNSPDLSTHSYLSDEFIPRLTDQTRRAVERGFRQAIELRYQGAAQGLGDYYTTLGRYAEAGDTFLDAARTAPDDDFRQTWLLSAGRAYAQAGAMDDARKSFELAIRNEPDDSRPYVEVTSSVLGPEHQLKAAERLVGQGVQAGADAPALFRALAAAAAADDDRELTETALKSAVDARPTLDALIQLGAFYLNQANYDRAALTFRQATERDPRSAEAYYYLGVAEEGGYAYSDAGRDFAKAVQLAPANTGYRDHYTEFERKVALSIKSSQPPSD